MKIALNETGQHVYTYDFLPKTTQNDASQCPYSEMLLQS